MDRRRHVFQSLKPACVHLSETIVNVNSGRSPSNELVSALDRLHTTLIDITRTNDKDIDEKLTDYVFYPISLVFRDRDKVPFRALEVALHCLRFLLQTGWRQIPNPQLAPQLLILLTFLAGSDRLGKRRDVGTEELRTAALECMSDLFKSVQNSSSARSALLETDNIPALGHTVTIILQACKDGPSSKLQLAAVHALQRFVTAAHNRDVLISFFPGIASALSQILTPSSKMRRVYTVYVEGLNLFNLIIERVLSDADWTVARNDQLVSRSLEHEPTATDKWLQDTQSQLKVALAGVLRLRTHTRTEVQQGLKRLCWTILADCEQTLSECSRMVLETMTHLTTSSEPNAQDGRSLQALVAYRPHMADKLRSSLFDALIAIPRTLLSNDDTAKAVLLARTRQSFQILSGTDIDMSALHDQLSMALTESLRIVAEERVTNAPNTVTTEDLASLELQDQGSSRAALVKFDSIYAQRGATSVLLEDLESLLGVVSASTLYYTIVQEALVNARSTPEEPRIPHFQLALSLLRHRQSQDDVAGDVLNLDDLDSGDNTLFEELYDLSLTILTDTDYNLTQDWRSQALALEGIALEAHRQKHLFRTELVDALYPVLHLIGSSYQWLRKHAMTSLNIISSACGYGNTQHMLVSNVDYLINAIGAKLNVFDISPQPPQVLLMMVKLCGPELLPYLDDLVENMFEALAQFHGYPALVELLFSVLKVIVEEGSKAPQFLLDTSDMPKHNQPFPRPMNLDNLVKITGKRKAKREVPLQKEIEAFQNRLPESTPRRPWSELTQVPKQSGTDDHDVKDDREDDDQDQATAIDTDDKKSQLSSQYHLVERISRLTQHHMPNASSTLRASLLSLLNTSLPFLSTHDDTFLPLVHTLWPILVARLEDEEAFVVANVLDVMSKIVEGAGDFVSARVESLWERIRALWKSLVKIHTPAGALPRRTNSNVMTSQRTAGALPISSQPEILIGRTSERSQAQSSSVEAEASALTVSASRSISAPAGPPASARRSPGKGEYSPTTVTTISKALSHFLVCLVKHVRISRPMYEDVLYDMLWQDVLSENTTGSGQDKTDYPSSSTSLGVLQSLREMNADALWLAMHRMEGKIPVTA